MDTSYINNQLAGRENSRETTAMDERDDNLLLATAQLLHFMNKQEGLKATIAHLEFVSTGKKRSLRIKFKLAHDSLETPIADYLNSKGELQTGFACEIRVKGSYVNVTQVALRYSSDFRYWSDSASYMLSTDKGKTQFLSMIANEIEKKRHWEQKTKQNQETLLRYTRVLDAKDKNAAPQKSRNPHKTFKIK